MAVMVPLHYMLTYNNLIYKLNSITNTSGKCVSDFKL